MSKTSRLVTLAVTGLAFAAPQVLPDLQSVPPTTPPAPAEASYQELAIDGPTIAAETKPFAMVGVTWPKGAQAVQARVRVQRAGQWGEWQRLTVEDEHGPDPASPEGVRAGTEPLWVGDATAVQASAVTGSGTTVADAKVVLIQPGVLATDADEPGVQSVEPEATRAPYPMPAMVSRKAWGADERLRSHNGKACARPKYTTTVQAAFVHHTADRNDYTRTQVPAMVRAMYAYHVKSRGWCDLGYNFLVDRFGRVFEGRYGGAQLPVLGAHTGSFNANSFGVALIGNYEKTAPSQAMLEKTARVIGGSVSTPIYRFAKRIGFRQTGQPFWGEHRTRTGWATYFATRDVFNSVATGTHSTVGVFRARYRQLGPDTVLGLPTTEFRNSVNGTKVQYFRNGALYWSKSIGTRPVGGLIYARYAGLGAERSRLGLPITDMYKVKGGLRQKYQHGWLTYNQHRGKVYVQYRSVR
ncbi:N-acetylmuramoyl-L-alanine amidase [Kribbella sp. NPDC050820]|uniref:N-acetylmuramoyl-L-alanine amidase n=1 Tax=Kribbella sp. NPDC050820 TaxID=3155408 RepID=UPI0033D9E4A9